MRDSFLSRRASAVRPSWARALQRAALLLAASVALFGSSLAVGRWTVSLPGSEFIYGDVLLAWIGMVAYVSAWPNLWAGLRDLQARQPTDSNGVVAWRAFSLSLLVAVATVVVLLLQYHALASANVWIFIVSWPIMRFAGWSLMPTLALHGIIFGRVARSLEPPFQYLTDLGALILFAVAAATSVMPCFSRCSFGTLAWVIEAGCSIRDSTPPRLSAGTMTSRRLSRSTIRDGSRASKLSMPPKRRICFFAMAWPGSSGRPG